MKGKARDVAQDEDEERLNEEGEDEPLPDDNTAGQETDGEMEEPDDADVITPNQFFEEVRSL